MPYLSSNNQYEIFCFGSILQGIEFAYAMIRDIRFNANFNVFLYLVRPQFLLLLRIEEYKEIVKGRTNFAFIEVVVFVKRILNFLCFLIPK